MNELIASRPFAPLRPRFHFSPVLVAVALVAAARMAAAEEPASPARPQPVLGSIAEIHALSAEQLAAGAEVRVRGIVTSAVGRHGLSLTVQQDGAATWVEVPPGLAPPGLAPGAEIEIEGWVQRRWFAPVVSPRQIVVVGRGPLPEPVPADFDRLSRGLDNARRVAVTGIVQHAAEEATEGRLVIKGGAWAVPVQLPFHGGLDLPGLLDARVRAVGVIGAVRNPRGELLSVQVVVDSPDDVTVVEPPRSEPFAAPEVSLETIGWFNARPLDGHRFVSRGTVSAVDADGSLYLQHGRTGVRVETIAAAAVAPGDEVDVAGFLDTRIGVAGICGALVRKTASGPRPEPAAITPDEILDLYAPWPGKALGPDDYAGCLVRFPATLVDRIATREGGTLVLASGRSTVTALMPRDAYGGVRGVAAGSGVEITGIVKMGFADDAYEQGFGHVHDWRPPHIDRLTLLVTRAADVVVTQPPPWWTPQRLMLAAGGLGAAAALAGAWAVALRREVRRQTTLAVEEAAGRRAAAAEFEATLRERNRLAVNLHDTVLQWLTGVDFQLKACETAEGRDDEATLGTHLTVARQMVAHAATQLRGTVWSLRSVTADSVPFEASLARLIDQASAGHGAHVSLSVAQNLPDLPPLVAGNLLLVLQEAIHNALHHAAPSTVSVTVAADRAGRDVVAEVRDDGCGFTVGEQVGLAQGHFGLDGMRERVERLGGSFAIVSAPGEGTIITARVPLALADAAPDRAAVNGRPSPVGTMTGAG